jgi:hypothetical protein
MSLATQFKKSTQIGVLALSLAGAGGLALSAGQAQALALNDLVGKTIVAGDKTISDITIGGGFTPTANQTIDFSTAGGIWIVSTNFAPDQSTTLVPSAGNPGILSYKITINDPTKLFAKIAIQGDDNTLSGGATDQMVTSTGVAGVLDSINGVSVGPNDFSGNVSSINVTSSFYTDGLASFNNISQKFTQKDVPPTPPSGVPGPLPLLGLGSAFGFSRRLRRRIATNG